MNGESDPFCKQSEREREREGGVGVIDRPPVMRRDPLDGSDGGWEFCRIVKCLNSSSLPCLMPI